MSAGHRVSRVIVAPTFHNRSFREDLKISKHGCDRDATDRTAAGSVERSVEVTRQFFTTHAKAKSRAV